jgi:hypothetical protein
VNKKFKVNWWDSELLKEDNEIVEANNSSEAELMIIEGNKYAVDVHAEEVECEFCKTTDNLISEGMNTSVGRMVFADLRFDTENNELDINYGLLEEDDTQGEDTTWSKSFKINFCPVCGRKLV